jgi:hypothetical protein
MVAKPTADPRGPMDCTSIKKSRLVQIAKAASKLAAMHKFFFVVLFIFIASVCVLVCIHFMGSTAYMQETNVHNGDTIRIIAF